MVKTALVSSDIERGAELLNVLQHAKVRVAVALWVYWSEYEDWRLVISGRPFGSLPPQEAYRFIHNTLSAAGSTPRDTPPLMILPMTDPFIKELRRVFAKSKTVEGMRLGGQMIADRFVEDAYVYRIA